MLWLFDVPTHFVSFSIVCVAAVVGVISGHEIELSRSGNDETEKMERRKIVAEDVDADDDADDVVQSRCDKKINNLLKILNNPTTITNLVPPLLSLQS